MSAPGARSKTLEDLKTHFSWRVGSFSHTHGPLGSLLPMSASGLVFGCLYDCSHADPYGFHFTVTCVSAPANMPPSAALWISVTRPYVGAFFAIKLPVVRPTARPGKLPTKAARSWLPIGGRHGSVLGGGGQLSAGMPLLVVTCCPMKPTPIPSAAPIQVVPSTKNAWLSGMYDGISGVPTTVPATVPATPPPTISATEATSWLSTSLPIAAATAPAPSSAPIRPDANSSSGRPERWT